MKRRHKIAAAGVVALILAGGGTAYANRGDGAVSYVTATAVRGDVARTVTLSGTVSSAGTRDVAFRTSGTVRKVMVNAGQRVEKGQVVAVLKTRALQASLTQAEANLAKARKQLADDKASQTHAASGSSGSGSGGSTPKGPGGSGGSGGGTSGGGVSKKDLAKLKEKQDAVTAASSAATDAISAAKDALAAQKTACATTDPNGAVTADCTAALAAVQDAQDKVAAAQDALQTAITDLTTLLTQIIGKLSGGAGPGSTATPSAAHTTTTGTIVLTAARTSGGSSTATGQVATAAQLASDQAAIDTAVASVGEARANLHAATLRAPVAGVVLQREVAKGDSVSSGTAAVILRGRGATEVSSSLTSAQLSTVKVGQKVSVTPAGWAKPLTGSVASISPLPSTSSTGSSTYPVVITIEGRHAIREGISATVSVQVGTATDAVTVPTSAIRKIGSRTMVAVLSKGTTTTTLTPVTVAVVGPTRSAIASGLSVGQQVAIAQTDAALPSSTTNSRFGGAGLGGSGFSGAGLGGSGFSGGPPSR